MESPIAATGTWGTVVWAKDRSGKSRALEFFKRLNKANRAKILATFGLLADSGRIESRERFKKLETRHGLALWEVKSFQLRFIGAFSPNQAFVVAHGLKKQQDHLRSRDLDVAERILKDYFKE